MKSKVTGALLAAGITLAIPVMTAASASASESVTMVFAARKPVADFRSLSELVVCGLREADACELLAQVVRWTSGKLGISSRRALRDALPDPNGLPLRA